MKEIEHSNLRETLTAISGREPHPLFGEPFMHAFAALHTTGNSEEITVAAYICSLFLSAIFEGFPTAKLHIFVNHTRENCSRFTFDCKMYDTILEKMDDGSLKHVALLNIEGETIFRGCCREDIKEAFDFYTNR